MNKKIFCATFFMAGAIVLLGVGCGSVPSVVTPNTNTETGTLGGGDEENGDIYGSAKDLVAPNALVSEVKSILSDACGQVKLTELLQDPTSKAEIWVYTWKNEPTEQKLINAFRKQGYVIDIPGEPLFVKKSDTTLVVSWAAEIGSQEIGVTPTKDLNDPN